MANVLHKNLTGSDAVHPAAFVQSSDPGAVGANLIWIDTTTGPPYTLKLRNVANTAWLIFAAGAAGATGATGATGPTGAAGANGISTTNMVVTGSQPYICIQDRKTSGTDGGGATSGSYQTRTLNTVIANDQNLAVLDTTTSRITLPAGTYRALISCPAGQVNGHKARLQSISSSATLLSGTTENGGAVYARSFVTGSFGLVNQTVLEVQHRVTTTKATNGYGAASAFGDLEVYTVAEFWLVAGPPPFPGSTGLTELPSFEKIRRQSRAAMY